METKRLFVAIFPPPAVAANLRAAVVAMSKKVSAPAIRWTRPDQIHLTLNFLGAIAIARIPEICGALAAACREHRQHTVRVAAWDVSRDQTALKLFGRAWRAIWGLCKI